MNNEKVNLRFAQLNKALIALEIMVVKPHQEDRGNIDATIKRFELTIELFWKFLEALLEVQGIEIQYPRDAFKKAYAGALINDEAIWLAMLKDRNLSIHIYDELQADRIYNNIKTYIPTLRQTFDDLYNKIQEF